MHMDSYVYVSPYHGRSFSDLPMEIILQIMSYLHTSDLYAASLACHRWFDAAQHSNFITKMSVCFSKIHLATAELPLMVFLNNIRNYKSICLSQVDFGDTAEFWEHFSNSIERISIRNCDIREKTLNLILTTLNRIKSLNIDNCRELFMTGRLFDSASDQHGLCMACKNVSSLSLTNNRYLSDALFLRFIAIMPKLCTLDLSGCHISFHHGLYKKFYPQSQTMPSESVLTFHCISKSIEQQAATLKHLNFSSTLIDGTALDTLSRIANLKLDTIILRSCDQLTNSGITNIVQTQCDLQELDLSFSVRLTDPALITISNSLPRLKVLKLRRCRAITDIAIIQIYNLTELKTLDISECELVTSKGILDGFARKRNDQMIELHLSALNICELSVMTLAKNLTNLRILDLSFCKNTITDQAIGTVFENLCWLRELNLEYCDMISDAGTTGMSINNQIPDNLSMSSSDLSEFESPHSSNRPPKISLRSKAEQNIVDDAKRKRLMLEMCESNKTPTNGTDHSIDNLKGLRILILTACNKITDVSLMYSFKLNELKELSLSKCQQVSIVGISSVINNCPSLEVVNLSECHNIDDKTIKLLTEKLKRLTHLYLERCIQLTDYSLDYIAINCTALKYLDVRGCRLMCCEPNLRLANLSSLKHVAFSKPGPYMLDTITVKRPKAPPLPPHFTFF